MSTVTIITDVQLNELVDTITHDVRDHDEICNFILELDRKVADYDFTVSLRDKLNEVIAEEDRAASAKYRD